MKIKGTIKPLRDAVFVSDMEFGIQRTGSGIFIPGADGKTQGIHPRWGKVWAIGETQHDVEVGDWILIEHGRWTRTFEVETDKQDIIEIRMVDNAAIMMISDHRPSDMLRQT